MAKNQIIWTPEEDAILRESWGRVDKVKLAELLPRRGYFSCKGHAGVNTIGYNQSGMLEYQSSNIASAAMLPLASGSTNCFSDASASVNLTGTVCFPLQDVKYLVANACTGTYQLADGTIKYL